MGIELTDRERYVLELREKEGKTFAEIGKEENVGIERARQIYLKAKRKERRLEQNNELDDIIAQKAGNQHMAMRITNALYRNEIRSIEDLMNIPDEEISRIRNLGAKSAELLIEIKDEYKRS